MHKHNHLRAVKLLGTDIGNEGVKTSKGVFFPSKVYEGNALLDNDALAIKVEWNNKTFIIGEYDKGSTFENVDKVDKDTYTVSLLTSIALSFPNDIIIDTVLGIGLPYTYSKDQETKEKYRRKTLELGTQVISIYINENQKITKTINILDVHVYAQGNISNCLDQVEVPALVVDFGGKTLDVTRWTQTATIDIYGDKIVNIIGDGSSEVAFGFNSVLDEVIKTLETKNYYCKSRQELISIIHQDSIKRFNTEDIDLASIKENIIGNYSKRVFSFLENKGLQTYPNVYFIGGCSEIVKYYITTLLNISPEHINVMKNSRFFNAINYAKQLKTDLDRSMYVPDDEFTNQNKFKGFEGK